MSRKIFLNPKFIITGIFLLLTLSTLLFFKQERREDTFLISLFLSFVSLLLLLSLFFTLESILGKLKVDKIRYLGSFFYHLGLVFFILAFFYKYLFGITGSFRLMLGEVLPLKKEKFLYKEKGIFASMDFSISVKLEAFEFEEKAGEFLDFNSKLLLFDHAKNKESELNLNLKGPKSYEGLKFYQTDRWGYAVSIMYNGTLNSQPIITHYFLEKKPEEKIARFKGEGVFEKLPYYFKIEAFYPDMMNKKNFRPELPGIEKLVLKINNKELGTYTFLPGQILKVKDGEFRFIGVSMWTEMAIKYNDGSFLIYVGGLFSSLGGLLLTFWYLRRSER